MSETSKWDDYFVRVGRYLESRDIEGEELDYKRETAQELARYRDELLSQEVPISIKPNGNLINLGGSEVPGCLEVAEHRWSRRTA